MQYKIFPSRGSKRGPPTCQANALPLSYNTLLVPLFMQYKFVLYLRILQKGFSTDFIYTYCKKQDPRKVSVLYINLTIRIKSGFDSLIVQM